MLRALAASPVAESGSYKRDLTGLVLSALNLNQLAAKRLEGGKESTPLMRVAEANDKNLMRRFLALGLNMDVEWDLNEVDNRGRTALHRAVAAGHVDVAKVLLDSAVVRADLKDHDGQ